MPVLGFYHTQLRVRCDVLVFALKFGVAACHPLGNVTVHFHKRCWGAQVTPCLQEQVNSFECEFVGEVFPFVGFNFTFTHLFGILAVSYYQN